MKKYTKPIVVILASVILITILATMFIPQFSRSIKMPDDEHFFGPIQCHGDNTEDGTYCYRVATDTTGLQGIVNKSDQWLIEPKYESIETYRDYAIAICKGTKLQIAYDGRVISDSIIEDMEELTYSEHDEDDDDYYERPSGLFSYTMGGRKGLMSSDGRQLTPPTYKNITAINSIVYRMFLDDESSILLRLDERGELIPIKFNLTQQGYVNEENN